MNCYEYRLLVNKENFYSEEAFKILAGGFFTSFFVCFVTLNGFYQLIPASEELQIDGRRTFKPKVFTSKCEFQPSLVSTQIITLILDIQVQKRACN